MSKAEHTQLSPSCTLLSSVNKGRSSPKQASERRRKNPSCSLLKQALAGFSSAMTSSPAWCEIFSSGSCKCSSFGFSSAYKDWDAKGTGSFCGQMKLILCTRAPPQGRDYSPGNKRNSLTSMHVRKSRVCAGCWVWECCHPMQGQPSPGWHV